MHVGKGVEGLVTAELLVRNEGERPHCQKMGRVWFFCSDGRRDLIRTGLMRYWFGSACCRSFGVTTKFTEVRQSIEIKQQPEPWWKLAVGLVQSGARP
jgi:hypothetical protein